MDMQPVTSGLISAIGYDHETNTLAIEFARGGTYEYSGVPEEVFTALMTAESVGKYFLANVKPVYTDFTKS